MAPIQTSEIQFHANGLGIQLSEQQIQEIKQAWELAPQAENPTQFLVQLIKAKQ